MSIVVVLSFTSSAAAQRRQPRPAVNIARISKGKPTVYITFVRFGKRESLHINESDEGVWLRVHNNTRWSLIFRGFGFFTKNDDEVTMFYGVEEVPKPHVSSYTLPPQRPLFDLPPVQAQTPPDSPKVKEEQQDCDVPPGDWGIDVVAPIRLPSGKSVIFSVPREALCKNLKIYIEYNYAWERKDEYDPLGDEPEHRVYFYGSSLSKIAR